MPIPSGSLLTRISGVLAGGEVWSCGLWWQYEGSAPALQSAINSLNVTNTGPMSLALGSYLATGDDINRIDAYLYLLDGNTASAQAVRQFTIAGAGTRTMPNQVSLVQSLRTVIPGRRGRGRVFVPVGQVASSNLTAGQLTTTEAQAQATRFAAFLNDWEPLLGQPCVVSTVGGTSDITTRVEVDTRFDIQRRRAAQQAVGGKATAAV